MKMFKVLKGSPCEVIESKLVKVYDNLDRDDVDIAPCLSLKTCSEDKIFTREECIADFVRIFDDVRMYSGTEHFSCVESYIARSRTPMYAFERGGWIAFYESCYVELVI